MIGAAAISPWLLLGPLLTVAFRLAVWLLLTNDLRAVNMGVGLGVALLLPLQRNRRLPLRQLALAVRAMLAAFPQAFREAAVLITPRPTQEGLAHVPGSGRRSSLLMFLEVFTITLTPLSICLGMDRADQNYRVHTLTPVQGR